FGNGAEPLIQNSIEERSYLSRSGWLSNPMYIVGAPGKRVTFCDSIALSSVSGSGFGINTIFAPFITDKIITVVNPYTWKNGNAPRTTSSPAFPRINQTSHIFALATKFLCVSMTPFG